MSLVDAARQPLFLAVLFWYGFVRKSFYLTWMGNGSADFNEIWQAAPS